MGSYRPAQNPFGPRQHHRRARPAPIQGPDLHPCRDVDAAEVGDHRRERLLSPEPMEAIALARVGDVYGLPGSERRDRGPKGET
jgi:hypothetical protein